MQSQVHINDVGTKFTATIVEDGDVVNISSATTKQFTFKRPDGSTLIVAASFVTDGSDGQLSYTTVSGDIATAGQWYLQAKIIMPTGTFFSETFGFYVYGDLI